MATNYDIVRLNVGGQRFVTTRATLCAVKESMLASMFRNDSNFAPPVEIGGGGKGREDLGSKSDGEVFLDRNPVAFGYILDYLRDGCQVMVDVPKNKTILQRLRVDADYFGLGGLVVYCDKKLGGIIEKESKAEEAEAAKEKPMLSKDRKYEYKMLDHCKAYGPGWKLLKYIPPIVNPNGKTLTQFLQSEKFIFERIVE